MPPKIEHWSMEREKLLADFMQARPWMWDPRDPQYYKSGFKRLAYEECAGMLGQMFTSQVVKDRWTSIRTTFLKNHRKLNEGRAGGAADEAAEQSPRWPLYNEAYVQFLTPTVKLFKNGNFAYTTKHFNVSNAPVSVTLAPTLGVPYSSDLLDSTLTQTEDNTLEVDEEVYWEIMCATPSPNPAREDHCHDDDHLYFKKRKTVSSSEAHSDHPVRTEDSRTVGQENEWDLFAKMIVCNFRNDIIGFERQLARNEILAIVTKYHKDNPINQ